MRRAASALQRGDLATATPLVEEALRLAPRDDEARRVAIERHVARGNGRAAIEELKVLMREVPGALAGHFENLERNLRHDDAWAEVELLEETIRRALAEARAVGVPAVMWRGYRGLAMWTSLGQPGFFRPDTGRFVAVAPRERGYPALLVEPAHDSTLSLMADVRECQADFCPQMMGGAIVVRSLQWPFAKTADHRWTVADVGENCCFSFALALQPAASGALVEVNLSWPGPSPVLSIQPEGVSRWSGIWRPEHFWATVAAEGVHLVGARRGYVVNDAKLETPSGVVELDPLHQGVLHSVDVYETWAVVVTLVDGCICEGREEPIFQHFVSVVDLSTSRSTLLLRGQGAAAARFGADGTLYVQRSERLDTLQAPYEDPQPVREGVLLTIPRMAASNCCGL